jgi:hypothetical protein
MTPGRLLQLEKEMYTKAGINVGGNYNFGYYYSKFSTSSRALLRDVEVCTLKGDNEHFKNSANYACPLPVDYPRAEGDSN